jgi:hypothetical protein
MAFTRVPGRRARRAESDARLRGGAWWDFLDPAKNGVANAFDPNKNGVAKLANDARAGIEDTYNKAKNEVVNPDSKLRGEIIPMAGQVASTLNKIPGFQEIPGLGELSTAVQYGAKANDVARSLGFGEKESHGALVARVMRERKCSLGAAAKHVKAHGLWVKKPRK